MNKCPHCDGTTGYTYSFVERVNMLGSWGDAHSESAQDFDVVSTNKYVKCFDCGKRVELEVARAVEQSVKRTDCPHEETFVEDGYVCCMACGERLHEAIRR